MNIDRDGFERRLVRELRTLAADHPLVAAAVSSEAVQASIDKIDWSQNGQPDRRGVTRLANEIEDFLGNAGQPLQEAIRLGDWWYRCYDALCRARQLVL